MAERKKTGGQVLNLYKRLGETPRERLERLRREKPQYAYEVLSYAGRLDPMAEGVLLTLVGPENARHDEYLDLSKEYTLDILFGFATDTYDVLGKVLRSGDASRLDKRSVEQGLREFRGKIEQEYPPYSSKTVEGKPLFEWARSGIEALILPRRTVNIYHIDLDKMYKVPEPMLLSYIEDGIAKVNGDFRQEEIVRLWRRQLSNLGNRQLPAATVKIACSSGTYARSIANELGELLGVPALALHILRTKVGEYSIEKSLR